MKRAALVVQVRALVLGLVCFCALPARAHVGSPDIFYQGQAGPYRLMVTVRPPEVIPGVASVQIRADDTDIASIRIVPLPVEGEAAQRPPTPDLTQRSTEDRQLYSGALWLMEAGSWQVRVIVDGARGSATLAVPVPALPQRTRGMNRALAAGLMLLLILLCAGVISIATAAARESTLPPGQLPGAVENRRARTTLLVAALLVAAGLWLGNQWWNSAADQYSAYTYKPLAVHPSVDGNQLTLELSDPGWLRRRVDDWAPDHDHLMHLFVLKLPALDQVWHLHPSETGPGRFSQTLPSMPAGHYRLFGDLVHRSGLAETVVADFDLPELAGTPLQGDDAAGAAPTTVDFNRSEAPLAGGARLIWLRDAAPLLVGQPSSFHFRAVDAAGNPTHDLEPYMGMLGHAAFVARDLSVFAHVHPSGSVPMASLAAVDPHAHHHPDAMAEGPSEVSFPFGLPKAGEYRVFVQIKRHGSVETAAYDIQINSSK